jgi:hypothetical protein
MHPHDFAMELAAEYAYPIAPETIRLTAHPTGH